MRQLFNTLAKKASYAAGTAWVFVGALIIILVWAICGPIFGFNNTWQLVINTGTTIITFLMVFLIQHTQNVDTAAMQIKLDELIRATRLADNIMLGMDQLDEKDLAQIQEKYEKLASAAHSQVQQRRGQRPPPADQSPGHALADKDHA